MNKKELKILIMESIKEVKQEQWIEYTKEVIKQGKILLKKCNDRMKKDGYEKK
jgi:N-methylhydantoinase B/oxoprolinase/acetone carboxylase alpha subunit